MCGRDDVQHLIDDAIARTVHDVLAVRGCHHPRFEPAECQRVAEAVTPRASSLVLALDPDSGLMALYLDDSLVWDFGPHDPLHGPLGISTGLDDALETLCGLTGVAFETRHCHPISYKSWTDYGWEWDSVWPQQLGDAIPATEPKP